MHRQSGLAPGWYLCKLQGDAPTRQVELAAAATLLNGRSGPLPGLGPFLASPSRFDFKALRGVGDGRAALTAEPVGFQFHATLRHVGINEISDPLAEDEQRKWEDKWIAKDAQLFVVVDRRPVAAALRAMVERVIAPAAGLPEPVRLISLGGRPTRVDDDLCLTVCVSTVGHDFNVDVESITSSSIPGLEVRLEAAVAEHGRLAALRSQAQAAGIWGWIDGAAANILASSGLGVPKLLDLLRRSSLVELTYAAGGGSRPRVALRWLDGVVSGSIGSRWGDEVRYKRGSLIISDPKLPQTLMLALPGRPLGSLLGHPIIPAEPIITGVRTHDGWLHVDLDERPTPITADMLVPSATSR